MAGKLTDNKNKREPSNNTQTVAKISIIAISSLIAIKVFASILTGSVSIRADAIHSGLDLLGAIVGFYAIRYAQKPADQEHAYGHSKAENIAGVIISGIIFIAAGTIVYEAINRMITGATIELVSFGIIITACAIIVNLIVSRYALRVARSTDSVALEATARDMTADVLSSCAVLVGLILVNITKLSILDPIVALLVSIFIVRAAYITIKKSIDGLMDASLPLEEQEIIMKSIDKYRDEVVELHKLRTRKAGPRRFIDFHLVMSRYTDIYKAHELSDQLQQDIQNELAHSNVTIHIEPCDGNCQSCSASCKFRQE